MTERIIVTTRNLRGFNQNFIDIIDKIKNNYILKELCLLIILQNVNSGFSSIHCSKDASIAILKNIHFVRRQVLSALDFFTNSSRINLIVFQFQKVFLL